MYSMSSSICGEFILSFHESIEELKVELEIVVEANPNFQDTLDTITKKVETGKDMEGAIYQNDECTGEFISIEKHNDIILVKKDS